MEDNRIVKAAAVAFMIFVVAPVVMGGAATIMKATTISVTNINHKRKIKKGLKNGSIVEKDGQYYEVVETIEEEA